MKFLLDRCAGRRLALWLRQRGHDVSEARERGPDPGDRILLHWAAGENRILVTLDKDFGEFVFVDKSSHCGIIRLPDIPADKRILIFEKLLSDHRHDLETKSVVTVRAGRIRISQPPSSR